MVCASTSHLHAQETEPPSNGGRSGDARSDDPKLILTEEAQDLMSDIVEAIGDVSATMAFFPEKNTNLVEFEAELRKKQLLLNILKCSVMLLDSTVVALTPSSGESIMTHRLVFGVLLLVLIGLVRSCV